MNTQLKYPLALQSFRVLGSSFSDAAHVLGSKKFLQMLEWYGISSMPNPYKENL